jgi:hypothetical protein
MYALFVLQGCKTNIGKLKLNIGYYRRKTMASLAEIRAKLKEQESRGSDNNQRSGGDNSIYPFWNLKEGSESVVRFLPDGNTDNTFFWAERAMIKLPFAGVKGETDSKQVQVQVPCMEMYGGTCPILSEVRAWFKDPALEDMGRKYWKKRSYIFQGFVVEDGLKEDNAASNPIRRFIIGPQIFQLIRGALLDPEMDNLPTDAIHGVDFKLAKTSKGGYADYSTSSWKRRERPLGDNEQGALKEHGLFNLSDFLPKKPGEVELKVIKEMFEASVDGEAFDMERWGQYYKPAGMGQATGDPVGRSAPKASAPTTTAEDPPFDVDEPVAAPAAKQEAPASTGGRAEDILAMIRNRNK